MERYKGYALTLIDEETLHKQYLNDYGIWGDFSRNTVITPTIQALDKFYRKYYKTSIYDDKAVQIEEFTAESHEIDKESLDTPSPYIRGKATFLPSDYSDSKLEMIETVDGDIILKVTKGKEFRIATSGGAFAWRNFN